jgi:hypothetical protein
MYDWATLSVFMCLTGARVATLCALRVRMSDWAAIEQHCVPLCVRLCSTSQLCAHFISVRGPRIGPHVHAISATGLHLATLPAR